MKRRKFLGCASAAAALGLRAAETQAAVAPGWDWSLPAGLKPVSYSGFVTWGKNRFSEMITVQGIMAGWRALSPNPGEYNWGPLQEAIEKAKSLGMRIGLHIKGVERQSVPDWVIRKYNVPVLDVIPLQENQPWRLQIVPPWHPGVLQEYANFMDAFSRTGIPQREDVVYGYIHGISPSRGEEWFLRPVDIDDWEMKAGLTANLLAGCLRARVDGMLKAFHGVEYKLAFMGGPIGSGQKGHEEYAKKTSGLLEYAIGHGTGWRGGGVDFQHTLFQNTALGSTVTPDGYCVVDETLPLHKENRYCGDENEEYGKYWEWRFGPVEQHGYRHRICTLKTLLLRQNFQYVGAETLRLNPELNQYAMLTQGRQAQNSPDAWAYLRECAIKSPKGPLIVKNLERWLVQRDIDGNRSVAAERVDRFPLNMDPPGRHYDFDGRRTDVRSGQSGLAFQIDTNFWPKPAPALLKVTFVDRENAAWQVDYADSGRSKHSTAKIQNSGDNQLKTATFRIDALSATRSFPGQMDFRILTDGPGDVTVTMVRLVKGDWKG
jgi:hypothetical protein